MPVSSFQNKTSTVVAHNRLDEHFAENRSLTWVITRSFSAIRCAMRYCENSVIRVVTAHERRSRPSNQDRLADSLVSATSENLTAITRCDTSSFQSRNAIHFYENKRPQNLSSEIKSTQQAILDGKIKIQKIGSKDMLPIPREGIAKFVVTLKNELITLEAASGMPRNTPKEYSHPSIVEGPILAAGWVYPDPHYPDNYLFANLSGHYQCDRNSLDTLKIIFERIGLSQTKYRVMEYIPTPTGTMSIVEMDLMNPKWNNPVPEYSPMLHQANEENVS